MASNLDEQIAAGKQAVADATRNLADLESRRDKLASGDAEVVADAVLQQHVTLYWGDGVDFNIGSRWLIKNADFIDKGGINDFRDHALKSLLLEFAKRLDAARAQATPAKSAELHEAWADGKATAQREARDAVRRRFGSNVAGGWRLTERGWFDDCEVFSYTEDDDAFTAFLRDLGMDPHDLSPEPAGDVTGDDEGDGGHARTREQPADPIDAARVRKLAQTLVHFGDWRKRKNGWRDADNRRWIFGDGVHGDRALKELLNFGLPVDAEDAK